ncbi:hypothetical protein [Psychrobacillus sp.]|uniref:hypothetical protein n=1 Tax=Psychrobacillus sp. TaxID=1871623 RepID=UPI0028BE778F|nr:hypothetical protein [Psychrobacillus sp.]
MKKVTTIITFALLLFVISGLGSNVQAQASEKSSGDEIVKKANDLAEKYGFKAVSDENISTEATLNFDSIEEFEVFLKTEQEKNNISEELNEVAQLSQKVMSLANTTKTYTYKEYTGVSVITSYAQVTRNSKGIVTNVNVWSDQSGINVPIKYLETTTFYTLNSSKTGGTATIKGTKFYGVNVVGQEVGYSNPVTYTVSF